jgi:hypothetical protein
VLGGWPLSERRTRPHTTAGAGKGLPRGTVPPLCSLTVILFGLLPLLVTVCALVDLITRPDDQVKHLPKAVWILLIVFLPLIGSIVWFCVGHDWDARREPVGPPDRSAAYERAAVAVDQRVRSTEQQLADLEEEEERHYARIARMRQLQAEQAVQAARAAGPVRPSQSIEPGSPPQR